MKLTLFFYFFRILLFVSGCDAPCGDHDGYVCGCSDALCGGLGPVAGEEHERRWVVYSVGPKPPPAPEDESDGNYNGDDVPDEL